MPEPRPLAFVAHPGTVDRLPADAVLLPLSPWVRPMERSSLAPRPEALLSEEDHAVVDAQVERILEGIRSRLRTDRLRWRGVDLGECFLGDVELGLRDSVKALQVIDRSLERVRASYVVTDLPMHRGAFAPYPYLSTLGTLLRRRASRDHVPFRSLAPSGTVAVQGSSSLLAKAYLSVATKQGLRHLREDSVLLALGPYPGFYLPVARAARAQGRGPLVVVARARQPMRADSRSGLFVLVLESFFDAADREAVDAFRRAADATLDDLATSESPGSATADTWPLVAGHLRARFDEEWPGLAAVGLAFGRGLERARSAFVLETESPLARAFVRFARSAGIPVTVLQHGILAGAFSYSRTDADRVAAWGPSDASWFRTQAKHVLRAESTGCPRYDGIRAGMAPPFAETPRGKTLVLYASQPFVQDRASRSPWDRADTLRMALDAAAQMRDVLLAVKWHPAETSERLPPGAATVTKEIRQGDALGVIPRCRAVLAVSSTVAFEAMALDRPVVFLGPADPASPFHPPEDGGGRRALTSEELVGILRELLPEGDARAEALEAQREFLHRNYAPLDGHAAARIVRLAESG